MKKKILVCVNNFETGGVNAVVSSIYRGIDPEIFDMDFISLNNGNTSFEKEITDNGNRIYYIKECGMTKIPYFNYYIRAYKMVSQIRGILREEKYDIVHIHANADIYLPAAKKLKIPVRIYQSHEGVSDFNGNENKSRVTDIIWKNRVRMYNRLATVKAGDSKKACIAKFGADVINDPKMAVIHPPVDMNRFDPALYNRDAIIKEFGINTEAFNMVHVGRLNPVKNQSFMIDVLKELNKKRGSELYIVGDGDMKNKLVEYAEKSGVADKVHFLPGNTTPGIYTAMDCSLLPSFSEAFGMVAVESQVMGVPCFASVNVPDDVDIGMCSFLELDAELWAEKIADCDFGVASVDGSKRDMFSIKTIVDQVSELYKT